MVFFGRKSSGFSLWDFLLRHVGTIGIIILSAFAFCSYMYLTAVNEDKKLKKYKKLSKRDMKSRKTHEYKKTRDTTRGHISDEITNGTKIKAQYDSGKMENYSDDEYDNIERHHRRRLNDDKKHHHGYEARHRRHMYDSD